MKIVGKDLEFWFDGQEVPVNQATLSAAFDTIEATDSATPDTGKDFLASRASRTFSIEAFLYEPDGAEISSGSLTAGVRYRVTAGSIIETQGTFTAGQIFESDGSGVASASDKVVPLGSKIAGTDMSLLVNAVNVPLTDLDFSLTYDELDVTDSETTGDAKETEVSRADRETRVSGIVRADAADLLTTTPSPVDATLTFGLTATVDGKILPISKEITDSVNDVAKIDYSFKWIGFPTETGCGLVAGVQKPFKIILKRGGIANKEYTGNCIITAKTVKGTISGIVSITYTVSINGAMVENEYAA